MPAARTVPAAGIVGQCHIAASATVALSVAVPEAFTAACHTAFQSWRSCGIDSHRAAHLAVRWHLEGEGHVRAIVETVPCALAVGTGLLGRAARNAGTVLEATDGHHVAASDGQGTFRLDAFVAGRLGIDSAAIDDHSAIGLDGLG